jgi:hypothetical protein
LSDIKINDGEYVEKGYFMSCPALIQDEAFKLGKDRFLFRTIERY